jgi:hypothetical protein
MPPCPQCLHGARVCTRGWNPGGPRVVVDVDDHYYSFSGWYFCAECKTCFTADHPGALSAPSAAQRGSLTRHTAAGVMAAYPPAFKSTIPFMFTFKAGIDNRVLFMTRRCCNGQSPTEIALAMREYSHNTFMRAQAAYYRNLDAQRNANTASGSQPRVDAAFASSQPVGACLRRTRLRLLVLCLSRSRACVVTPVGALRRIRGQGRLGRPHAQRAVHRHHHYAGLSRSPAKPVRRAAERRRQDLQDGSHLQSGEQGGAGWRAARKMQPHHHERVRRGVCSASLRWHLASRLGFIDAFLFLFRSCPGC